MSETITVTRDIAAPPDELWTMVSDVTRMGDWSPETTYAEWCQWAAEMFIPFSQLRFSRKNEYVMGINFDRYIVRKAEDDYFSMVPDTETGFVSKFGLLTDIAGIEPPVR